MTNGADFLGAISKRLNEIGELPTDTKICQLIRTLSEHEIQQIVNFGITDKWKRERIEALKKINNI